MVMTSAENEKVQRMLDQYDLDPEHRAAAMRAINERSNETPFYAYNAALHAGAAAENAQITKAVVAIMTARDPDMTSPEGAEMWSLVSRENDGLVLAVRAAEAFDPGSVTCQEDAPRMSWAWHDKGCWVPGGADQDRSFFDFLHTVLRDEIEKGATFVKQAEPQAAPEA